VTPEEIKEEIDRNRAELVDVRARQMRDRLIYTALLDEPEDEPSDEELETKRFEPLNAAQVQEIP
jgi:hypothetical protein